MSDESDSLTPAQRELESALQGLAPAVHQIDRDLLMFRLGCASVVETRRRWRMVAAALLLVSVVSWAWSARLLQTSPTRRSAPPDMAMERGMPPPDVVADEPHDPRAPSDTSARRATELAAAHRPGEAYLDLRNLVLARGVDVLPVWTASAQEDTEPIINWPADQRPLMTWLRARQGMQEGGGS